MISTTNILKDERDEHDIMEMNTLRFQEDTDLLTDPILLIQQPDRTFVVTRKEKTNSYSILQIVQTAAENREGGNKTCCH